MNEAGVVTKQASQIRTKTLSAFADSCLDVHNHCLRLVGEVISREFSMTHQKDSKAQMAVILACAQACQSSATLARFFSENGTEAQFDVRLEHFHRLVQMTREVCLLCSETLSTDSDLCTKDCKLACLKCADECEDILN